MKKNVEDLDLAMKSKKKSMKKLYNDLKNRSVSCRTCLAIHERIIKTSIKRSSSVMYGDIRQTPTPFGEK